MRHPSIIFAIIFGVLVLLTSIANAQAQEEWSRWETSVGVHGIGSSTVRFDGGSSIALDNDIGFGFEVGYNFSPTFNLSLGFNSYDPHYRATIASADPSAEPDRFDGSVALSDIMLNGRYSFTLRGPITPFVSAGIGYLHIDTDVPSGPPLAGCWWDPWWGYVCDYFVPTRQEDDFAYQAAVGAKWELSPFVFLRGSVGRQWINVSNAGGNPHLDTWKLDIGFNLW